MAPALEGADMMKKYGQGEEEWRTAVRRATREDRQVFHVRGSFFKQYSEERVVVTTIKKTRNEKFGSTRWAGCLLGLLAILMLGSSARAYFGFTEKQNQAPEIKLVSIIHAPRAYKGQTVRFRCRYALQTNLFKAFNTQYDSREFTNFAAWVEDAKLWEKSARRNVIPTFYVKNTDHELIKIITGLRRYELMEVTATVTTDYAGLPWMTVTSIETVNEGENMLNDRALKYIQNGQILESQNRYIMAADQFQLADSSGIPQMHRDFLYQRIGHNLLMGAEVEKAESWLLKAREAKPDNAAILMELAEVNLKLKRAQAALDFSKEALAHTAEYPELHAIQGEAYGLLGQYEEGLKACEVAINTPGVTPFQRATGEVHRARVLTAAKRYPQAVAAYVRALSEESPLAAEPWLRKEIGLFYEVRYLENGQRSLLDEAIREYGNANVISQNRDLDGLYRLANAYYLTTLHEQTTDFTKSQEILTRIDAMDPVYLDANLLRGRILLAKGDVDGAQKVLARLAEAHPKNVQIYLSLAEVDERQENWSGALEAYRNAARVQEGNAAAWRKVAALAERVGELQQAREAFERLTIMEPDEAWNWHQLARMHLMLDEYDMAISSGTKASVSGKAGLPARLIVANAAFAKGDFLKAKKALDVVVAEEPQNAEAALLLARIELEKGKPQNALKALEYIVTARKVLLDDPMAVDTHAWAMYLTGDTAAARDMLMSLPEEKRTRSAWYHLGVILSLSDDLAGSEMALEKAASEEAFAGEYAAVAQRIRAEAKKLLQTVQAERKTREHAMFMQEEIQSVVEKAIDSSAVASYEDVEGVAASAVEADTSKSIVPVEEKKPQVTAPDFREDWQKEVKTVDPAEVTSLRPLTEEEPEALFCENDAVACGVDATEIVEENVAAVVAVDPEVIAHVNEVAMQSVGMHPDVSALGTDGIGATRTSAMPIAEADVCGAPESVLTEDTVSHEEAAAAPMLHSMLPPREVMEDVAAPTVDAPINDGSTLAFEQAVRLPGSTEDCGELLSQSSGQPVAAQSTLMSVGTADQLGYIPMSDITIRKSHPDRAALQSGNTEDANVHYNDVVYEPELYEY